jgi:hypothetical protein
MDFQGFLLIFLFYLKYVKNTMKMIHTKIILIILFCSYINF